MSSALDNKAVLRLMAQYNKAVKEPNEFIKFAISDLDPSTWYILIRNIAGTHDEYVGSEFIFEIKLPKDFPFSPPEFYAQTPNGLYDLKQKCCISIGVYHKADYRASLGVAGFARELANGLMTWEELGHGINLINTSVAQKKKLSKDSVTYNQTYNKRILNMIDAQYENYSKKWDVKTMTPDMRKCLNIADVKPTETKTTDVKPTEDKPNDGKSEI